MPEGLSRRDFLKLSAASAAALALEGLLPTSEGDPIQRARFFLI